MADRKIIFKCRVGSHLYGTNRPESDEDYYGVFLPSTEDLLSLSPTPRNGELDEGEKLSDGPRNQSGDTDCKYFTLQKFLKLAAEGQPGQLEMLFATDSAVLLSTPEWNKIKANKDLFLSKKGIAPFLGFALSQAHKAVIKGENLNVIQALIEWSKSLTPQQMNAKVVENAVVYPELEEVVFQTQSEPSVLKYYVNEHGYPQVMIAGRSFDVGTKTKYFIEALKILEAKYGTRVRAAAQNDFDYKSLGHAVRLLGEAEEFLTYGMITLPRPDAEYLKTVLRGTIDDSEIDWFEMLNKKIDYVKQVVEAKCTHPEKPRLTEINKLCIEMLKEHLNEG